MSGISMPYSTGKRYLILLAAFLGWMFAGLEISLFVLIHRPMMLELLAGQDASTVHERDVTAWFAWFQAAFLFGAAAGGWLFGWLGDRIGRTRSLACSILCYSLMTLISYTAADPFVMLVLRFLACMGIGGSWPNAVALSSEAWPNASRPLLAGLLGTAANVGFVLLGVIGLLFDITPTSWRWVLLVGSFPIVIALGCFAYVPESTRWLSQRNRSTSLEQQDPIRELFLPPLLRRTVLGIVLGAIPVVGTAANANWLVPWSDHVAEKRVSLSRDTTQKPDPKSKARTQITRSSGAVLGSLLGGILATLLGRKTTYFFISLFALLSSTYIFGTLDPETPNFTLFTFILGFVGVVYFGWLPLYLPELFPTRVRATGTGISFNSGRIVAAFIVLGAGVLVQWAGGDYASIGLWTGSIYAVGMVIILFAPRTDSGQLED